MTAELNVSLETSSLKYNYIIIIIYYTIKYHYRI